MVPNAWRQNSTLFAVLVTIAHDKGLLQKTPDTFLEHVLLRGCIFIPYFFKSHVLFLLPAFDFKAPQKHLLRFQITILRLYLIPIFRTIGNRRERA